MYTHLPETGTEAGLLECIFFAINFRKLPLKLRVVCSYNEGVGEVVGGS